MKPASRVQRLSRDLNRLREGAAGRAGHGGGTLRFARNDRARTIDHGLTAPGLFALHAPAGSYQKGEEYARSCSTCGSGAATFSFAASWVLQRGVGISSTRT